ncbi:MAG: hypothetical protein AAF078_13365 [Planctomycetota bacterium]
MIFRWWHRARETATVATEAAKEYAAVDPQTVAWMRDLLVAWTGRLATAAKRSVVAIGVLACFNAASVLGVFWLLWSHQWHWGWGVGPTLLLAVPAALLGAYWWFLSAVVGLPERVAALSDDVLRSSGKYRDEFMQLEGRGTGLLTRWRTYWLVARVLWHVYGTVDEGTSIWGGVLVLAVMSNPLFWLGLLATGVVTLAVFAAVALITLATMIF